MGNLQDMAQRLVYNQPPQYDWEKYRCIKKLGEGGFGEVFLVVSNSDGKKYALKKIRCSSNDDLEDVTQELKSMSKLAHPNIMKQLDTRIKQKQDFVADAYMILEFCPGGTLSERLSKPSSNAVDRKWMVQLSSAVAYIHSLGLVHRDLKPDNVLLTNNDNIKVGDFGLAREFVAAKREDETWEKYYMASFCGTLFYLAPEVFNGHYTEKADVFALGVLLYAIAERECFNINGTRCYGLFVRLPDGDLAPLGLQMYLSGTGIKVAFSKCTPKMVQIIGSTILYDQNDRKGAKYVLERLKNI